MHIKKLLAVFLSTAMFITSGLSSYAVADTEFAVEAVSAQASEESSEDEAGFDKSDYVTSEDTADAASGETTGSDDEEEKGQDAAAEATTAEAEVPDEEKDASKDASSDSASEETSDAADEASSEDAADAASSEDSTEELILIEEDTSDEDLVTGANTPSDYFEVDENYVLQLKEGRTLGSDPVIPLEAKKISDGFFKNKSINSITFQTGSQMEDIGKEAFYGCTIKKISIPAGVTEIKEATFKNSSLEVVTFEGAVTTIGDHAFDSVRNLYSIAAGSVTSVGDYAFFKCSNLKSVAMSSVQTIGESAFANCKNMDSMPNISHITSIGDSAFLGCGFGSLDLRQLPAGAELGNGIFEENTRITNVTLPKGMTEVPGRTFYGCIKLTQLIMDETVGLAIVGKEAFYGCTSLTEVIFPATTRRFEEKAFDGCTALKAVTIQYPDTDSDDFFIAEDAFPANKTLVLSGYDGKVERYATIRDLKYETLYPTCDIFVKLSSKDKERVSYSVKVNGKEGTKARKNDYITVTVTPKEGYTLSKITVGGKTYSTRVPELIENAATYQVFGYTMPDGDVTVEIIMVENANSVSGKLTASFVQVETGETAPVYNETDKNWQFGSAGKQGQMIVKDGKGDTNKWLWNYTSSNTKIATVNAKGIVRGVAYGITTIKATLKTDSKISVSVNVFIGANAVINNIELKLDESIYDEETGPKETVNGVQVPVIVMDKYEVARKNITFTATIKAFTAADPDTSLYVTSEWKSVDTAIVGVSSAKTNDNKVTCTIKKGAVGEAMVTVGVKNAGDQTATPANTKRFIVRVVDSTPRLVQSEITVNGMSIDGTAILVLPVYGHDINNDGLKVTQLNSKTKDHVTVPDFVVREGDTDNVYYVLKSENSPLTSKVFSGTTQLYLTGRCTGADMDFHIPIKKLTLVSKVPNPTLKTTGKINLFYTDEASGAVTVKQSIKDIELIQYKLVSAANNKKDGSEAEDTFAANFDVAYNASTQTFEFTRKPGELKKVNNKVVTSGYLYIQYSGFEARNSHGVYEPVWTKKAITVPTSDTAPAYVLSKATVTANELKENQVYPLELLDKKTKKTALDLSDAVITQARETTAGLFKEEMPVDGTELSLQVDGAPRKGKAVLLVKKPNWNRELKYTFTLKVTKALPGIKLSAGTVTLNTNYPSQEGVITASSKQDDAEMDGFVDGSVVCTGGKNKVVGALIAEEIQTTDDSIIVTLPDTDVPIGTYNFKITPKVKFDESTKVAVNAITFKVNVVKKSPTLKLKSSTITLNAAAAGKGGDEVATTTFTLGNLPTKSTGKVTGDAPDFVPGKNVPELDDIATVSFEEDGTMKAALKGDSAYVKLYSGKKLTYTVKNLMIKCGDDPTAVPVTPFTFAIKLNSATPSVTLKTAGTINPIDGYSKVSVTAKVNNIVGDISNVVVTKEYIGDNAIAPDDYPFVLTKDASNTKLAYVSVDPEKAAQIVAGKKYYVRVQYTIDTYGNVVQQDIPITVKQTVPSIKTENTTATLYAGQTEKTMRVKITVVQPKTPIDATMLCPKFVNGTSDDIYNAFEIVEDSFTWDAANNEAYVTIKLKNSAAVVLNKTYSLNLETRYYLQALNTTANKFTVKVTVKK